MGKNRRLRNGVDQVQTCSVIETLNCNQDIPQDFLTSDDFCVVQKKRGCKKFSENQGSCNLACSLPDSEKTVGNNEAGSSHSDFWTCKFDGAISSFVSGADVNASTLSHASNGLVNISEITEVSLDDDVKEDNLELNSNQDENKNISGLLKSPQIDSDKNVNLGRKLSDVQTKSAESLACCSKKKNKKKICKNSVEEEVEELLKKLGLDESFKGKGKSNSVISTVHNNSLGISATACDMKKNVAQLPVKFMEPISDKNFTQLCDGNNDSNSEKTCKGSCDNSVGDQLPKISLNQKVKVKISQKNIISHEDLSSDDTSQNVPGITQGISNEEYISVNGSEEKILRSKSCGEFDKKNKKRPGKKQLALIHEALRKAKEEEERLKKEEEARQKMAEEAERARQEKLRLEQERKDKKKLKEKQRKEKLKAEGRLLSKSQKQARARMEATLAAFREQGIDVPQISDKRPHSSNGPRLGNCKNFHRKRVDSCQSVQSSDSAVVLSERQKSESFSSQESFRKESLSDLPSSFDSDDLSGAVESDKGHFSYSEESDGLEDITCSKSKKIVDSKNVYNLKKNGVENVLSTQQKSESGHKVDVKYRSPVVCVLGHVDTGKTKLLDYIRKTHVQDSEAGGITQQIGATMMPQDALKEKCKMMKSFSSFEMKIPGLLVIDTPGHESFSNLRSRGSSVCDIAILVVDIMHGLEPQTIESINLLKKGKTPFVVALNKVDRIYGWKSSKDEDIEDIIQMQSQGTQMEFKKRCQEIILQFANEFLNAALFYENKDPRSYVSMIPTSAITGDGMGNLLGITAQLTQSLMHKKLIFSDELEATVLEVKAIPGLGTTIDVILVNGCLHEGDTIVLAGQEGPLVAQIRSLLMPQPLKELRVKNPYIEYKAIEGAQGVKVTGKDLDKSLAGSPILVAAHPGMVDVLKEEISHLYKDTTNSIKTSERGVYVQASTLGSLEALLDFLSSSGIPYFSIKIGPVVKKDVMKASIMLEHDAMYAAILAFDVKIERDAQELADSLGVRIFQADIIYHLFDLYVKYQDDLLAKRQEDVKRLAVFPCKLKVLPEFIFSPRDPIVLGVLVEQGILKEGTPLCIPSKGILEIGFVSSIELNNNNKVDCAKKGDMVCIKIDTKHGESPKTYGKHFSHEDVIVSRICRQSIDACKEHFRNELQSSDWHLMVELKKMLHIV